MDGNEYEFQPVGGQSSGASLLDSFSHLVGGAASILSAANGPSAATPGIEKRSLEPTVNPPSDGKWKMGIFLCSIAVIIFLLLRKR